MARRWWLLWVGLLSVAAAVLIFWFFVLGPIHADSRWHYRVRTDILSLASKRPPDVSRGHWEFFIGWTINLHANIGPTHTRAEYNQREQFADELERRLQGPVDTGTIDWIWDEYARFNEIGQRYSDRYRPTRSVDLPYVQEGTFGIPID